MQISINTADPRPIYVQIMDEVRRAIVLRSLRPEDPLPSVRQLSSELRVNPNTVAQAYRELERAGTVYVRRGQGTFVAAVGEDDADRRDLVRGVAERALVEAHRNGIDAEELVEAIREAAASRDLPTLAQQS
ncbi:MAG TPA: GntR family transcriptional regulator [Longimicrobium sp.]|jgi:GntR family transcriptional regulator|uniref:GntR family transcriptional regulator n=1 Tax=Longimicrobium sp. TaxID=2029185 RepID=UPI002EDB67FB